MKALYVVTAFPRHPGDVITPWLGETIRRLRRVDVDVEVLAPAYRGEPGGVLDGTRVHRFRYAPARWEDLTHDQTAPDRLRERPAYLGLVPAYLAAGMAAAARLARRGGFDVVHVHWPIPHALLGMAARRAGGLPLVCSFHGVELTWTARDWPVLRPVLRRIIRAADAVTANSSYTAGMIRRVHDRPVEIIPFGSTVEPRPAADDEAARDSAPGGAGAEPAGRVAGDGSRTGPDAPFELLFVGRLVERKGVRHLLDAAAGLPAGRPWMLHVVGDGPELPALRSRAAVLGLGERVRFHGFVDDAALARRFAACDVFVLPAVIDAKGDTEGLGVVLVEALAHGRPVVASGVGGIVDVVRHEETGLLVPPGDAEALRAALLRLMHDPALRRRLARAGAALVERSFSWPVITRRLADLYRRLVSPATAA